MLLNELKPASGSKRERRRIGRGHGTGWGKTAGKGHNGQKQRAGASIALYFEGGQMPLIRRIPKRGFSNHPFKKELIVLNLKDIVEKFDAEETVNIHSLIERNIVKNAKFINKYVAVNEEYIEIERDYVGLIKIIGQAEVNKVLNFEIHKISSSARESIEKSGGRVNLLPIRSYIRNEKKSASN